MPRLCRGSARASQTVHAALHAVLWSTLLGCTSTPMAPRMTTLTSKVPVITPQPETKESQEKGGLEISIAPVTYSAVVDQRESVRQVPPPPVTLFSHEGVYVEVTNTPIMEVTPDSLRFVLTVNNKLPRVFHGAGTIVQFNVGGRLQAVDQSGYSNFLGTIIPPRQEQQIEIIGPSLSSLPSDKGIIGVFLYDVATNQSAAGVVTEKQNFEWYFDYTLEPREQVAESRTEQRWMSLFEYQQAVVREQTGSVPGSRSAR
jgi:hypothetical protein